MRIEFTGRRWFVHNITEEEIRSVLEFPLVRWRLTARIAGSDPFMFVGRYDDNEPPIEVGAEPVTSEHWVVFHAMMLRVGTALDGGLDRTHPEVVRDIASQRGGRRKP
ncbi:MAG: hypothetical protein E6R04_03255 [Spirochaetes bacterium]|nr:MAG: hypothetical protein E6R04_03255 [Spirochaetota bacterium]